MRLIAMVLLFFVPCTAPVFSKTQAYLEAAHLSADLQIRDAQGGFVGFTGKVWTVAADGKWTVSSFINKSMKTERHGKFSADQLAVLAALLRNTAFATLPVEINGPPGVNPHLVSLKFGKLESTLVLRAGEPLNPAALEREPSPEERRFKTAVNGVLELMQ